MLADFTAGEELHLALKQIAFIRFLRELLPCLVIVLKVKFKELAAAGTGH